MHSFRLRTREWTRLAMASRWHPVKLRAHQPISMRGTLPIRYIHLLKSPGGKNKSSSDRFPLKSTGENITYSLQMELSPTSIQSASLLVVSMAVGAITPYRSAEIPWMVAKSETAPRNETMVETIRFVGICRGITFQGCCCFSFSFFFFKKCSVHGSNPNSDGMCFSDRPRQAPSG